SVVAQTSATYAQEPTKLNKVGFLDSVSTSFRAQLNTVFMQRLRELGWNEGQNLSIEYRSTEGRVERSAELATDLVRFEIRYHRSGGERGRGRGQEGHTSTTHNLFLCHGTPIETTTLYPFSTPTAS